MKPLLILAVGVILGYLYGFDDAKKHTHPVQLRVAEQIFNKAGGSSRGRVSGDIDARMQGSVR